MSEATGAETGTEAPATGAEGGEGNESKPSIEELLAEVETLKSQSRKWEDRSKANKDKADKYDAEARARMTDAEKASADLSAATGERDKAIEERDAAVAELARYKIITEFSLDENDAKTLANVTDEKTLRALAERLSGSAPRPPKPRSSQGKGDTSTPTTEEQFLDALGDLF